MAHLIDKDALIAEIEKQRHAYIGEPSKYKVLSRILNSIDTLEVKEINSKDALIEKVCNLLSKMVWEVTYEDLEGDSVEHYDKTEFIEEIRKYMKGD